MSALRWLEEHRSLPGPLAGIDSGTTLLRALSRYHYGEDIPALGLAPQRAASILPYGNYLPEGARQVLYRRGTAAEAIDPDALGDVDVGALRRWAADRYPERGYPAVMVGSANGAAVHLAALLGIPWLPQTFLLPVRRDVDPNEPKEDLEWGREHARALLEANPDVELHQAFDPNQDQLTLARAAYFRVKSRRLGPAYEEFLDAVLEPGGTVILVDCELEWPTTRVDDRHVFQFGAPGGLPPEEYREGSERVRAFLERHGDGRRMWDAPAADEQSTEAEWGFEPALGTDVERVADERGYDVRRLSFKGSNELSGLVADFYRDQYRRRGIGGDRLLVGSFALLQPWWALRTGSVPYWMTFNAGPDADSLEGYLDAADPYEAIDLTPVSNGVRAAGQAPVERWRSLLARAERQGQFLGVDPSKYPADFGTYYRYHAALPEAIPDRHPMPAPVDLGAFEAFVEDPPREYPVEWTEG
ncbi:hypothetical protein [Halalkalicoccus tibetensis]|uniref:Uncharacterized protein n=1 Tax=Halalkalicoccus tibetensis TaxID=175632 RepID=A0ABD5V0M8_9EURY